MFTRMNHVLGSVLYVRMTILDYSLTDLLFAHWMQRKRDFLSRNAPVPPAIDQRLDELRKSRNPNASIFVLDSST